MLIACAQVRAGRAVAHWPLIQGSVMDMVWLRIGLGALVLLLLHGLWQRWQLHCLRRDGLYPAAGQAGPADIRKLVQSGRWAWAMRCHREVHGSSLREAREAVHAMRHSPAPQGPGILEVAPLHLRPGSVSNFEAAFSEAQALIAAMPGYRGHELQRCLERPDHYLLLVRWDSVAHHEQGFRQSTEYQQWRALLHHFYDPFPTVLHYEAVQACTAAQGPARA